MWKKVAGLVALTAVQAAEVTPVQKVLVMLEDLQKQVQQEGRAEADVYNKFACFCKDMTDEKTAAIGEGETAVDGLMASLEEDQTARSTLISAIEKLETGLQKQRDDLDAEKTSFHEQRLKDEATEQDLSAAVSAVRRAVETLKASGSHSAALIQAKALVTDLKAVLAADPLNGHESDYDFHSNDIIKTLQDLSATFKGKFNDHVKEMMQKKHDHDGKVQTMKEGIDADVKSKEQKEAEREAKTKNIALSQQDLTESQAQLKDDQVYLRDVTSKCEDKAKMWDKRTQMRGDELSALSQAIAIIAGTVKDKDEQSSVGHVSQLAVHTEVQRASESMEGEDEAEQLMSLESFVQVQVSSKHLTGPRAKLVALLNKKASIIGSKMLSALAMKVKDDPFGKVKKLIQELIERLLQEAEDEADHKGWCDNEISKATQERNLRFDKLHKLNGELISSNARKDKLDVETHDLDKEVKSLTAALGNATEERTAEKTNNENTVKEAQEGVDAIKEAIVVLSRYYKSAANGNRVGGAAFIEADPKAPSAGFEGEYKGSQSAATGIMGMMQVIQSDFERSVSETNKAEKEAARSFVEFDRETKVSIKTKEVALETKTTESKSTKNEISEQKDDLLTQQGMLDASLKELEKLKPACAAPNMSYAERSQRREAEIDALKSALQILADSVTGFMQESF